MFKIITLLFGKKIAIGTAKKPIIEKFLYAMKYYKMIDMKVNKKTWTIKFSNESYSYTFILPKDFIKQYTEGNV